uniref:Uncharacterized protein n=1 Tax=mine drainage metagenome TaxID=410659 RepID=E6QPV9_9ZZZZ
MIFQNLTESTVEDTTLTWFGGELCYTIGHVTLMTPKASQTNHLKIDEAGICPIA